MPDTTTRKLVLERLGLEVPPDELPTVLEVAIDAEVSPARVYQILESAAIPPPSRR